MQRSRASRVNLLVALLREERATALRAAGLLLAQGMAAALAPRLLGVAVDVAPHSALRAMILIGLGYLLIELVRIFSTRLQAIEFSKIGQGAVHRLRLRTFDHIMSLPWSEVRRIGPADLLSRLTVDIRSASALFEACFLRIIERLCGVSAILIGILSISLPVGLAGTIVLPFLLVGAWYTSRRLYTAFFERQTAFSRVTTSLSDSIELKAEVNLMGLSTKRVEHFARESAGLASIQQVPSLLFGRLHATMSVLTAISIGTTLILGRHYIEAGLLTRGQLVTLIAYVGSIIWPLILIIDQWSVLLQGLASVDRILEVLSLPIETSLDRAGATPKPSEGETPTITFENVAFCYPETGRGIREVSFCARRGEKIGIIGSTGSGKSTISRLLLGLVKPDTGTIFIDGAPLSSLPPERLRESIGFMPQHPEMFSVSPRENITLWDSYPERFEEALQSTPSPIRSLLNSQKDGLSSLSLGEQQFIAALRVLVRAPSIIILDEPTASIDSALEQWLMDTIFSSSPQTTYLIIAHRITTLQRCDRILVLDEGMLVGEGRHEELLDANERYSHLVKAEKTGRTK